MGRCPILQYSWRQFRILSVSRMALSKSFSVLYEIIDRHTHITQQSPACSLKMMGLWLPMEISNLGIQAIRWTLGSRHSLTTYDMLNQCIPNRIDALVQGRTMIKRDDVSISIIVINNLVRPGNFWKRCCLDPFTAVLILADPSFSHHWLKCSIKKWLNSPF